jgi:nucleotide-binding universal stress UspA family protein
MYRNILIAVDGSDLSARGLDHGLDLAKAIGAKVVILTVTEHWLPAVDQFGVPVGFDEFPQYDEKMAQLANGILDSARKAASAAGVEAEFVHQPNSHPSDGILGIAKERGSDLIVMSSHGRHGIRRLLLGSQAMEVLSHSEVPVLVVK